jgi:anti-sigma B factor antagonist
VVRPVGELDALTAPTLEAQINELREAGFRRVVLDLRGLSFMDSTGLHLIFRCDEEARQDGFAFELISGTRAVQRVFEVAGFAERLPFVDA